MVELLARIIAVFDSPLGMAVLVMAMLAFAALFVFVFWEAIRQPRRDNVVGENYETAPPPLMAPELVSRTNERSFTDGATPMVRNAVLIGLGVLFVGFGFVALKNAAEQEPTARAGYAGPPSALRTASAAPAVAPAVAAADIRQVSLCRPSGSIEDRTFQTCTDGAAVRFDLLRFSYNDRFVVRPSWNDKAKIFVASESHATPFAFGADVGFAAPETVASDLYDGFLVIGVGEGDAARAREEALRDFAIIKLSGGDRSECATSERVFSVTANFDENAVQILKAQRAKVASMRKAARRNAKIRADLPAEEQELARLELVVIDQPAPLVLGIKADPNSSNLDEDMLNASRGIVRQYADDLQITGAGVVDVIPACARGGDVL